MTPLELAKECTAAVNAGSGVVLTLPRRAGRGERERLVPGRRRCPMGELLCETAAGTIAVRFDPLDVLAYLAHAGLLKVAEK